MKFNTRYSEKAHATPFEFTKDSMTTQEYGYCTDINNIIEGCYNPFVEDPKDVVKGMQSFSPDDYEKSMFLIADAKSKFEELPSRIRERFNNNPAKLLQFVDNPQNFDEGVNLGIFNPRAEVSSIETPTPVNPTPSVEVTPVTPVVSGA